MIKTQNSFIIGDHLWLQVVLEVSDVLWGLVEGQCGVELPWRILLELLLLLSGKWLLLGGELLLLLGKLRLRTKLLLLLELL